MDVRHTLAGVVTAVLGGVVSVGSTLLANPSCVPDKFKPALGVAGAVVSVLGGLVAAKGPALSTTVVSQ